MNFEALMPDYVRAFQAYVPSRPDHILMEQYGTPFLYRLNNNENHLGPPLDAAKIIDGFIPPDASLYPSGDCYDLRCALGEKFGINEECFLIGNGSCEVIASVIKAFCLSGDNIITADKTFAVYEWVAEFSGVEARLIPLNNFAFDPQGILDSIDGRTKIIFICNPNNPTGTYWNHDTLTDFLEKAGENRIVVVDEAYAEYVEGVDFPDCFRLMQRFKNLVVFRTFSKMYALAGLRVGYLAGHKEVVDLIRKTHVVYSVNKLGQAAALAAVKNDSEHIYNTRRDTKASREILIKTCSALDLEFVTGEGNFFMIKTPLNDLTMYRRLMKKGMMVRTMTGFRFPSWIRVTLKDTDTTEKFADVFCGEIHGIRG